MYLEEKIIRGLLGYVEFFDCNRPPVKPYLLPSISLKNYRKRYWVKKYDARFYEEIRKENEWYRRELQKMPRREAVVFLIYLFLAVILATSISTALGVRSKMLDALLISLLILPALYYTYRVYTKVREEVGREFDERLREDAQKVIAHIKEFFRDRRIDPMMFPIKLRHKDYEGLIYKDEEEVRGIKIYTAYLSLDIGK